MDPRLQDYLIERIEKIDEKVDQLLAFKWQIIGGAAAISVVVTACFQIVLVLINK